MAFAWSSVWLKFPANIRKWSPSGRKDGQRCEVWLALRHFSVTGAAPLPSALTRHSAPCESGAKRRKPLRPQLPPRGALLTVVRFCGAPPTIATLRSLPFAKNATYASSGDQKG